MLPMYLKVVAFATKQVYIIVVNATIAYAMKYVWTPSNKP
jgi:hypothetical protein